ncbi:MAG: hypothetical protein ACTHK7_21680, partial [Aureliella sp.]
MGTLYKRGGLWYADFVDRDGNRIRKSTKMRDKQLASKVLARWETDERLTEFGVKQNTKHHEPLETMLGQYEASLRAAGKSVQHVDRTGQLIRAAAEHNDWKRLGEISAEGVNAYAESLRTDGARASRTIASMVTAVRSFCRWCVRNRHLAIDPTATVEKPSSKVDRRIERRMILPEEWKWLRKYLEGSDAVKNGQSGAER